MFNIVLSLIVIFSLSFYNKRTYVEPEFKPFVEEFEKKCNCKIEMEIIFDNLDGFSEETAGVCNFFYGPSKVILIQRKYWKYYTEENKRQLIFHELGHCELGKQHNERKMEVDGRDLPYSFMYPSMFDYPENLKEHYDNELFNEMSSFSDQE